jgi:hypothetical protein
MARSRSQADQLVCVVEGEREGLLAQNIPAAAESPRCRGRVQVMGKHDVDHLSLGILYGRLPRAVYPRYAVPIGEVVRALGEDVPNCDDICPAGALEGPDMHIGHLARPDHGDPHPLLRFSHSSVSVT